MGCDLCGKETMLVFAMIEGSRLSVCEKCAGHGRIMSRPQPLRKAEPKAAAVAQPVETIVPEYATLIRNAREKKGMTQADFARHLGEKESIIHKLENGSLTPPVSLARKLEKLLRITLVTLEKEESSVQEKAKSSGPLTIGDFIKIKK